MKCVAFYDFAGYFSLLPLPNPVQTCITYNTYCPVNRIKPRVKFQAHSRHIHIQVTFGTHLHQIQVTFGTHSSYIQVTFERHTKYIQWTIRKIQITFKSNWIYRKIETMDYWDTGILKHCNIENLEYWEVGILRYLELWVIRMINFEMLHD